MPQGNPRSGEIYRHFKNHLYQVMGLAHHTETGEALVIYQALYGDFALYARPLSMFISPVDVEKYPQVKEKYRFTLVGERGQFGKLEKRAQREDEPEESGIVSVQEESNPLPTSFLAFLDADQIKEKYEILKAMPLDELSEGLLDTMAVSLDTVLSGKDLMERYDELKQILATKVTYESARNL